MVPVNNIKVVIAEDHTLYRQAMVKELSPYNITCVGEATNGKEVFKFLDSNKVSVVVLDLEMPEMSGKDAFLIIKKRYPSVKTIIVSQHDDRNLVEHFEKLGVDGYLPKACVSGDVHVLAEAIHDLHIGKTYFIYYRDKKYIKYTNREREIIPLICDGKTNKEIAQLLDVDEKTIEKHRKNLFNKTNSRNIADFLKFSFKRGLDFMRMKY